MPINKTVQGDLIRLAKKGQFDVIIHGCNCMRTMGKGIAANIKGHFPDAYSADYTTPMAKRSKLGTYSSALCKTSKGHSILVVNAYTQFDYRKKVTDNDVNVDYDAIKSVFATLNGTLNPISRIGIPKIGAGLAGGDWDIIKSIIDDATPLLKITLVEYVK